MTPCFLTKLFDFNKRFESFIDWLYLDVKGLVSIGNGFLVDPPRFLAGLDFVRPDGTRATASEVQSAWLHVKNMQAQAKAGGGTFEHATTIRATQDSMRMFFAIHVTNDEKHIKDIFPDFDTWPEACRLATHSMAYAMGPDRIRQGFPSFIKACNAHDWVTAATQSHMSEVGQNESFRKRNKANEALFLSAV